MIELISIVALIILLRRLGRAVRAPRRVEVHVYHHGLPGGPGERSPVFFEEPEDPSGNIVPFRRAIRTRRPRRHPVARHGADTPEPISRYH
jgi:hypothetical protein